MPDQIDIGRVIQSGSRQMDLGELAKLGHKKVRVIDERRIRELIAQAVQQTLERDAQDVAGRERREAAEKARADLESRLAESQAKLDQESLASKEVERLRSEVTGLQGKLVENTQIIEAEKRRLAEASQKEFQRLLASAREELEAKRGVYEKALHQMLQRADKALPKDEAAAMPALPPEGGAEAAQLLEALNQRLQGLSRVAESATQDVSSRDQDIALAAAERRRQEMEINRLRDEIEKLRTEVRERERQLDSREQDVAMAALAQRRLSEENRTLRQEAAKVAELSGENRRLSSERELLLSRFNEAKQREASSEKQTADFKEALGTMKGALTEEIARQVSWALSAQKTGVQAIDPNLQLEVLFSQQVETNIESVKVEERSGQTLAAKLAKLREARGK